MKTKTNILIVIAVIAMLLLALISTGLSAYQSLGMARGFNPGSGQFPEGMPDQRNFPSDGDMTTPPNFEGNPQTVPVRRCLLVEKEIGSRVAVMAFLVGVKEAWPLGSYATSGWGSALWD